MDAPARRIWGLLRSPDPIRFGELALALGKIRPEHLERAVATQGRSEGKARLPLGEILIREGALTTAECAGILLEQERLAGTPFLPRVDRFVLLHELGRGGMGVVWRAWDSQLRRPVALKMLRVDEERDRLLLHREARMAAQLDHSGIVPIYEVVEHGGNPCIAMGLVEGATADVALRGRPVRRILEVVRDAARAVHYAHGKGVVHRDLKPLNLMVDREDRVTVMDFGLAKSSSAGYSLSKSGGVVGTPTYMSPEQALGKREAVGPRSDVYGLGATLYHLISGRFPFEGDTPARIMMRVVNENPPPLRRVRPEIHRDIETIVAKAMEKEPSRRYATAEELADDLDRALGGLEIVARPVSSVRRFSRRFRRAWVAIPLGVVALAGLGWAYVAWRAESARKRATPYLEEARQALEQADRSLFRRAADLNAMREQIARAERAVERAIAEAPRLPDGYFVRAQIRQLEGEPAAAEADFSRALELDPGFAACRVRRALFRLAERMVALEILEPSKNVALEAEEVAHDLERAVASGSGLSEADRRHVRVALLVARRNYEEAERRCAETLQTAETEDVLRLHAFVLNRLDRRAEAAGKLTRAIQLRYYDAFARIALANLLRHDRRWKEAREQVDVAATVLRRQPEVFAVRGLLTAELGDPAGALADLERAVRERPDLSPALDPMIRKIREGED